MELNEQLTELVALATDNKTTFAKLSEEVKNIGTALPETKDAVEKITVRMDKLQTQLDAADLLANQSRFVLAERQKDLIDLLFESKEFIEAQESGWRGTRPLTVHFKNGAFPIPDRKSVILTTDLGSGTAGVLPHVTLPGIVPIARQELRIRDLMTIRKMGDGAGNTFEYVRQTTRTNAASPQVESSPKAESTYAWDAQSGTIRTIAHFVNLSKQALFDSPWLRQELESEGMYGLLLKEESEILSGDGLGVHLNGLITQATAYSSGTYNVSGDTKLDILRHAKLQARLAGLATFAPDAFVVHPTDMHTIELIKDQASNVGNYVVGAPKQGTEIKFVWGIPVVESDSIAAGRFLVGSFGRAAQLIDRMAASMEISFEHASNFTSNLATVLFEERIGLAVTKPTAFITGTY